LDNLPYWETSVIESSKGEILQRKAWRGT